MFARVGVRARDSSLHQYASRYIPRVGRPSIIAPRLVSAYHHCRSTRPRASKPTQPICGSDTSVGSHIWPNGTHSLHPIEGRAPVSKLNKSVPGRLAFSTSAITTNNDTNDKQRSEGSSDASTNEPSGGDKSLLWASVVSLLVLCGLEARDAFVTYSNKDFEELVAELRDEGYAYVESSTKDRFKFEDNVVLSPTRQLVRKRDYRVLSLRYEPESSSYHLLPWSFHWEVRFVFDVIGRDKTLGVPRIEKYDPDASKGRGKVIHGGLITTIFVVATSDQSRDIRNSCDGTRSERKVALPSLMGSKPVISEIEVWSPKDNKTYALGAPKHATTTTVDNHLTDNTNDDGYHALYHGTVTTKVR